MKYVVGLVFHEDLSKIAMIRKNRPEWQKGLLNGVGGKIEEGETPLQAIIRETEEEFGIVIDHWDHMIDLQYDHAPCELSIFRTKVCNATYNNITSMTDEEAVSIDIANLDHMNVLNNLQWLIRMALYEPATEEPNRVFLSPCTEGYVWLKGFDKNLQDYDS